MNQNLPKSCNNGKLCITIDNSTRKIEKIDGIKLNFYEHQKVLIQQMIDIVKQGYIKCDEQQYDTKDIWLKSSIGTGKSLCLLSLIQYFKNNNYQGLRLKVPQSMSVLQYIKAADGFFKQQPFSQKTLYQQIHNINYYNFEMSKQQGYVINEQGRYIQYASHRKQSLLFVQQQVYTQFEEYIKDQTSLTYSKVDDPITFLDFIFDNNNINKTDIILWNVDTVNIHSIFVMMIQYLQDYTKKYKLGDSNVIDKQNFIQKNYGDIQRFNDFWIKYQNLHNNVPFTFVCYDDFDMIKLPTGYPIDSLYNIFVGSTMISRVNEETNVCSNFILNKHINNITGFRVNEEQLQKILSLPPNHVNKLICATPSRLYIQFKMMQYIRSIFDMIVKTEGLKMKENKSCMVFNDQVFNDLIVNKVSFAHMFVDLKNYDLVYEHLPYSQGFMLDLINNLKMICKGEYIFNQSKYTEQQKQDIVSQYIQPYIYENIDSVFTKKLYTCKQYKTIIQKIQNMPFKLDVKEIKTRRIVCPLSQGMELSTDCYITRCCSQPFNKEHKDEVIYYDQGMKYCAFCQSQIQDIDHYLFDIATQEFVHDTTIVQTNKKRNELYQVDCLSKLQQLYKLIKQSFANNKKIMIIMQEYNLADSVIQSLYKPEEIKDGEFTLDNIIKFTRRINMYVMGSNLVNYNNQHRSECLNYIRYITRQQKITQQQCQDLVQQVMKYEFHEENPDITVVKSLHQIIGANMTHIDQFIFFNVPEQSEEVLQIIGRSRRIGRRYDQDIDSYFLYYPLQKITEI